MISWSACRRSNLIIPALAGDRGNTPSVTPRHGARSGAKASALSLDISKTPKRPKRRATPKQESDGVGTRSKSALRKWRSAPMRKASQVVATARTDTSNKVLESLGRNTAPSLPPVEDERRCGHGSQAAARSRSALEEPSFQRRDEAEQAVTLVNDRAPAEIEPKIPSDLPQPSAEVEMRASAEREAPSPPAIPGPTAGTVRTESTYRALLLSFTQIP